MEMPTITRVSLEPFCPACGGGLDMRGEAVKTRTIWAESVLDTDKSVPLSFAQSLMLICPWCRKALQTSEVAWREREKEEG